jgi:7,8-dihydropterin-6-yl-methyl-4-(beta-D-ribofuranosyl)aminobenzene 5'-phosphate synthase
LKTTLTILRENSVGVPFGVIGEHGFACYVETDEGDYLFDAGQGFGNEFK